jgi:hypothetical protein
MQFPRQFSSGLAEIDGLREPERIERIPRYSRLRLIKGYLNLASDSARKLTCDLCEPRTVYLFLFVDVESCSLGSRWAPSFWAWSSRCCELNGLENLHLYLNWSALRRWNRFTVQWNWFLYWCLFLFARQLSFLWVVRVSSSLVLASWWWWN